MSNNAVAPTSNAPIATVGDNLSLQGYTLGITEEASSWLSTELANASFKVPEGYDIKGEVSSAMVMLGAMKNTDKTPVLSKVTRESVLMFLKDMVTQGLSLTRKQCYAIPYGDELKLMRSYFGTIAALVTLLPGYKVTANVIFEGDTYDYKVDAEGGFNYIENHKSSLANRKNPIEGVYGFLLDEKGHIIYAEVMGKAEIDKAWSKAQTKNVQNDFPTEMAKRTLINRMCKVYLNTIPTTATAMQMEAYQRSLDNEYRNEEEQTAAPSQRKSKDFSSIMAEAKANAEEIPF